METELISENTFNKEIKNFANIEKLYETKFIWAAEPLIKSFMLVHYKQFITNMHEGNNIEIYLNEKKENKEKDFDINDFF